jgi:DNA-binding GntR family transcriptional regulator
MTNIDRGMTKNPELLANKAQDALWAALRAGTLREGQFVSMSQLVETLEYPIAAIREAVKQASSMGLLTTLPKRGVQIMEANAQTIRECLDFRLVFDQEGARRRISDGNLEGLDTLRESHLAMLKVAQQDAQTGVPAQAIKIDLSLHDYLSDGLGNAHLAGAYQANRMRIAIIQNARPFLTVRVASAMEEHLRIIDSLAKRDADAAIAAIRTHFDQTLQWWGVD